MKKFLVLIAAVLLALCPTADAAQYTPSPPARDGTVYTTGPDTRPAPVLPAADASPAPALSPEEAQAAVHINYLTETISFDDSLYEAAIAEDFSRGQIASGESISLYIGSAEGRIYLRTRATDSADAGASVAVPIPARDTAPRVNIHYARTMVSVPSNTVYRTASTGSWTPCPDMGLPMSDLLIPELLPQWDGQAATIEFRYPATESAFASQTQFLQIPAQPEPPAIEVQVWKTRDMLRLAGPELLGHEFSQNGLQWSDTPEFSGLEAGTAYTLSIRTPGINEAAALPSKSLALETATVNADGSASLRPGESMETSDGAVIQGIGDHFQFTAAGQTIVISGPDVLAVDTEGAAVVPGGGCVHLEGGTPILLPQGGRVRDAAVQVPAGGEIQTGDVTFSVPEGAVLRFSANGEPCLPPDTRVSHSGTALTLVSGGTITPAGLYLPAGGGAAVWDLTVSTPQGGVIQLTDGGLRLPTGSEVSSQDGVRYTVSYGKPILSSDHTVTFPQEAGRLTMGGAACTLPTGGTLRPGPDYIRIPGGCPFYVNEGALLTLPQGTECVVTPDGAIAYEVCFDPMNGTEPLRQLVTGGMPIQPPADPVRTGFLFGGWYTDAACTSPWDFAGDTVSVSLTLYAKWTPEPTFHVVTFDSLEGSPLPSQAVIHGGHAAQPAAPVRTGFTFGGWYADPACTRPWRFQSDAVTGDLTLYAKWTAVSSPGPGEDTSPFQHTILTPAAPHGTILVSPKSAEQGSTVTLTPKPEVGFTLHSLAVRTRGGQPLELLEQADGSYCFTMPRSSVSIEAVFRLVPVQEDPWVSPFRDVKDGVWYAGAVRFVSQQGLMEGMGGGRFGGEEVLSRAQLVQVLYRMAGAPGGRRGGSFTDVPAGAWYADAVAWAVEHGVASGCGGQRFSPHQGTTWEQLALMLWRYAGSPAAEPGTPTEGADGCLREALAWAAQRGVLPTGQPDVHAYVTRAQLAQLLYELRM